jgi:hypothetical protein
MAFRAQCFRVGCGQVQLHSIIYTSFADIVPGILLTEFAPPVRMANNDDVTLTRSCVMLHKKCCRYRAISRSIVWPGLGRHYPSPSCRKLSSQTPDTGYSSPRTRTPLAMLVLVSPVDIRTFTCSIRVSFVLGSYIYSIELALEYMRQCSFIPRPCSCAIFQH